MRLNIPTVLAVSGFALAGLVACSPSETDPAETLEVDTPPARVVAEEASEPDVSEPEAVVESEDAAMAEDGHDHAEDAHHEGEEHHEDGHDHEEEGHEHADHDHADEHSHDHDHDHGVGEAHVHGAGEMAIALDGATLTVSFESPLASFASFEHEPKTPEQEAELQAVNTAFMQPSNIILLNDDAGCASTSQGVTFRHSGDHGSIMVDYAFECASVDALSTADLKVFEAYPALETVDAVFLSGAEQIAKTLSAGDARLSLK